MLAVVTHGVDIPPKVAPVGNVLVEARLAISASAARCPDSAAIGTWVSMLAGEKMAFKVSDAILNGLGTGQPLGLLKAPCLVTVTKETSQAASTVLAENVLKMFSRMPARNRAKAVWIINQDVEPLLPLMVVAVKNVAGTENVGGGPIYLTPGGLSGSQYEIGRAHV